MSQVTYPGLVYPAAAVLTVDIWRKMSNFIRNWHSTMLDMVTESISPSMAVTAGNIWV